MDASCRRFLSRLESGAGLPEAVSDYKRDLARGNARDRESKLQQASSALATSSSSALSNLLGLVIAGDSKATDVVYIMLPSSPLPTDPPEKPFALAVAGSAQATAILKTTVAAMPSSDLVKDARSCRMLCAIASEPFFDNVRIAVGQGAISKVIQVVERWAPTGAEATSESTTACMKRETVTSAMYALNSLTQSSDNRCKAAIKAGAMQQLARLLAPGNTARVRAAALTPLHNILALQSELPTEESLAGPLLQGLTDVMLNFRAGSTFDPTPIRSLAVACLKGMAHSTHSEPDDEATLEWWSKRIGQELLQVRAAPGTLLREAQRRGAEERAYEPLVLLSEMNRACGTQQQKQQLAAAIVGAGGIEILRSYLHLPVVTPAQAEAAAARGDYVTGRVSHARFYSSRLLQQVVTADNQYAALLTIEDHALLLDSSTAAAHTQFASSVDELMARCAKCGAEEGEGVKLLVCSRCKRAGYCSAACQRAHWKVHKAQCADPGTSKVVTGQ